MMTFRLDTAEMAHDYRGLTCLAEGWLLRALVVLTGHVLSILEQASPGSFTKWWLQDSQEKQDRTSPRKCFSRSLEGKSISHTENSHFLPSVWSRPRDRTVFMCWGRAQGHQSWHMSPRTCPPALPGCFWVALWRTLGKGEKETPARVQLGQW